MTPPIRHQLADLIQHLQKIEPLLLRPKGATIGELEDATGMADKSCRRYLKILKTLGVPIEREWDRDRPATWHIRKRSQRLFYRS